MNKKKIELLAPAKNLDCGISAINHGADAIYIGGPQFGARASAGNSLADIEKLVVHAHQFRARVYVALNTIFDDRELVRAVELCHHLHGVGVDALIIQDVGLLESDLPPIPLHSSTQMNNRTAEKVRFLEEVGFQQVVLARELSLEQIKEIRAATTVPLEFFVHGALCVSYSGQCYISEVMAGRSANRGECAQFCRHRFSLKDGQGRVLAGDRYLLSLKDLNLSAQLEDLIDAGISSFKIEGRLKDENYVKNVTAYYRQALDRIIDTRNDLQPASSGKCSFAFSPDPARSFNRGFTDYFLNDQWSRPGGIETPKSRGRELGKVVRSEKRFFVLETEELIKNGDGLCYLDPVKGLVGLKANRVEGSKVYPKDHIAIPLGVMVYRNVDTAFKKLLARSEQCRFIGLELKLEETDDGLLLRIRDEDGMESESRLKVEKEQARQAGMVRALAEKQLRKVGGSLFSINDVQVTLDPSSFYPAAVFNDLRRKGFTAHLDKRLSQYQAEKIELRGNDFPWPAKEVSYFDNITNQKAESFYRRHGVTEIDRVNLQAKDAQNCDLMTTRYCIKAQLNMCPKKGKKAAGLVEPLVLVDNSCEYQLSFDCLKCEMIVRKNS